MKEWKGRRNDRQRERRAREGAKGRDPEGLVHTPVFEILKNTLGLSTGRGHKPG